MVNLRWMFILLSITLVSCSGGSGGSTSSIAGCSSVQAAGINSSVTADVPPDTSVCYTFTPQQNKTYKITASSGAYAYGIAIHDTGSINDNSNVVVYDVTPDNVETVFTADNHPYYVLELYSVDGGSLTFNINEVPASDYVSANINSIDVSLYSSYNLPNKQSLIQPDIIFPDINVTRSPDIYGSPTISYADSSAQPDWLGVTQANTGSTGSTDQFSLNILNTNFQNAINTTTLKIVYKQWINISVFAAVNVTVNAKFPPFNISANNQSQVQSGSDYSFSISSTGSVTPVCSVGYGPNGMSVDSAGNVTWPAKLPMFKNTMKVNWGIKCGDSNVAILDQDSTDVADAAFKKPLIRTGRNYSDFSGNNIKTGDVDGDGKPDIVITDANKLIYEISYDGATYKEKFVVPYALSDTQKIKQLELADLDGDKVDEILVALEDESNVDTASKNSKIVILDGRDGTVLGTIATGMEFIYGLQAKDIDGDGVVDIVVAGTPIDSNYGIKVFNSTTLSEEWSMALPATGGLSSMYVANVDNDSALEIVTGKGYVIDGATHAIEWYKDGGFFGYSFTVGDTDNDGVDELILVNTGEIDIYSAVTKSIKSSIVDYLTFFLDAYVGDIYGNGKKSLIVTTTDYPNNVIVYDYQSASNDYQVSYTLPSLDKYTAGIHDMSIQDLDNDGKPELLWREGGGSTGTDGLVIAGMHTDASSNTTFDVEWYTKNPSDNAHNSYVNPYFLKYPDSTSSIIFGISSAEEIDAFTPGASRLLELSMQDGTLSYHDPLSGCSYSVALLSTDYNADTYSDFVYTPCNIDLVDNQIDMITLSPAGFNIGPIASAVPIDMDNNGNKEVAAITNGGVVYLYDILTGNIIWSSSDLGYIGQYIAYADGYAEKDLVFVVEQPTYNTLYIYSRDAGTQNYSEMKHITITDPVYDMLVSDLDGDGKSEIVVYSGYGTSKTLTIYDTNLNIISTTKLPYEITSMHVEDLPSPRKNILLATRENDLGFGVTSYETNKIRAIDPYTGHEIWHSPSLLSYIPNRSLRFADVDGNGSQDMYFTTTKTINVIYGP